MCVNVLDLPFASPISIDCVAKYVYKSILNKH